MRVSHASMRADSAGTSSVAPNTSSTTIANMRRKSSGSPKASITYTSATVANVNDTVSPVTIPSGRRRPPVAPADRTTGRTGSTHGETAVAAPASSAKSASSAMRVEVFYGDAAVTDGPGPLTHAQSALGAFQEAQERLHHQWIELRARASLELLARALRSDAHVIGAVSDHRLVGVGDGEDARLGRDLGTTQAGRVARAVRTLVMREHPAREVLEPGAAQQPRTKFTMLLDLLPLTVVQRPGLLQHLVWHPNLADVVQHSGELHALDSSFVEAEFRGDHLRVAADRLRVGRRAGVAHVDGLGKHEHRRQVAVRAHLRAVRRAEHARRHLRAIDRGAVAAQLLRHVER